jgi:chloramphenicol-sensitive protein RarD
MERRSEVPAINGDTGGVAVIFAAYFIWGAMPIYWKLMSSVGAMEILAYRAAWACVFILAVLVLSGRIPELWSFAGSRRRSVALLAVSGATVTLNWYIYIWAVNNGRILETSLGYFINPLISIMFGVAFFGERLRLPQLAAIGVAACGVCIEAWEVGGIPVVSLGLAVTFGLYGVEKKMIGAPPLVGMALETAMIFPFAVMWIIWAGKSGAAEFPHSLGMNMLLAGAGALTAIPLILFSWGVVRIPMVLVGFVQYISPTISFLVATLIYHEPMPVARVLSFSFIWAGIIIFTAESLLRARKKPAARAN